MLMSRRASKPSFVSSFFSPFSFSPSVPSFAFAVLALASFSVGCGESSDTLAEVEALKEKVCACKDTECVSKLKAGSEGLEKRVSKLTTDDMDKALKVVVDMMKCASELGVSQDAL